MRVAVDASSAAVGGGVTYLRRLLPLLAGAPEVEIGPVLVREAVLQSLGTGVAGDLPFFPTPGRLGALTPRWRRAVARADVDVVLAPTEISFASYRCPLVLAVRNPSWRASNVREYPPRARRAIAVRRALARRSARTAAAHIAVSGYARELALGELGIPANQVHVVYHGGPPPGPARPVGPVRRFLFVSNLYRYKNLHRLLAALAGVDGPWHLEVVGAPVEPAFATELGDLVRHHGLATKVTFAGPLSGAALDAAYAGADCFLWPPYAETFGHPLLEAHSFGLPILAARAASNEEIAGEAARYFDPFDVEAQRTLLHEAVRHGIACGDLPRDYSWEACATQTVSVLRAVVDDRKP